MRGFIIVNSPDNIIKNIVEYYLNQAHAGLIIVNRPDNIANKIVEYYTDQAYAAFYYCQSSG